MYCNSKLKKDITGLLDLANPLKEYAGKYIDKFLRESVDFTFNNRYYAEHRNDIESLLKELKGSLTDKITDQNIINKLVIITNDMLMGSFRNHNIRLDIDELKLGSINNKSEWLEIFSNDSLENPFTLLSKARGGKIINKMLEDENYLIKGFNIEDISKKELYNLKETVRILSGRNSSSKAEKIVKLLGATSIYTGIGLASGLLLPSGLGAYAFLMLTQVIGMPSEILALRKESNFALKDIQKFREKYGILFNIEDSRTKGLALERGPLGDIISHINKLTKHAFPDIYNVPETLLDNYRKNLSLNAVLGSFSEFAGLDTIDDIMNKIDSLPINEKNELLKNISDKIEEFHRKQTSISSLESYGKAILQEGGLPKPIKEIIYYSTSFFGHRGQGHVRNGINILKDIKLKKGNIIATYLEALEIGGKEYADEVYNTMILKQEALNLFFNKIIISAHIGYFLSKNNPERDVEDVIKTGAEISYGIAGLNTTARGRELIHTIGNLWTYGSDGFEKDDMYKVGVSFLEEFMNNMSRRYALPKVALGTINSYINSKDIKSAFDYMIRSSTMAAAGFIYYYGDSIEKAGRKINTPTTNNQLLDMIIGGDLKKDFMKINKEKRLDLLAKKTKGSFDSWMMYHIPFVRDWNFGAFGNSNKAIMFMDRLSKDKGYMYLLHGYMPEGLSDNFYEYAYNLSAKFGKYENKRGGMIWYDNLRKDFEYKTKKGGMYKDITNQAKEDLFINEMELALGKDKADYLIKKFQNAVTTKDKVGVQMLGFLEAMSPGAGRELVSQAISDDFSKYVKSYIKRGMSDTQKKDIYKKIRIELGKKYGDMLYYTDKQSYSNLLLFYGREKYPGYNDIISDPYSKNGSPVKKITFINTQGDYKLKTNKMLENMFLLESYTRLKLAEGDMHAGDIKNAFATIWMGGKIYKDEGGIDIKEDNIIYDQAMFNSINEIFEALDNSSLSTQSNIETKMGILITVGTKLKRYSENIEARKKLGKVFDDTLHWLFDTAIKQKDIEDMTHYNKSMDKLEEKTYGSKSISRSNKNSYGNSSGYYRRYGYINSGLSGNNYKSYVMTKPIYEDFRKLKNYPFYFSKAYNGYSRYYPRTNRNDYDYKEGYYKGRSYFFGAMRNYGNIRKGGGKKYEKPEGYRFTQYAGYAVPKGIKKDLSFYDPTDRESKRSFLKPRRRKTVKYDSNKTRRAVNKGGVYNLFSKRGIGNSSNSRSKRRNTSRSKSKKRHS